MEFCHTDAWLVRLRAAPTKGPIYVLKSVQGIGEVQEGEEASEGSPHSCCETCRNGGPLCDRYVHLRILGKELVTDLPNLLLVLSVKIRGQHT